MEHPVPKSKFTLDNEPIATILSSQLSGVAESLLLQPPPRNGCSTSVVERAAPRVCVRWRKVVVGIPAKRARRELGAPWSGALFQGLGSS